MVLTDFGFHYPKTKHFGGSWLGLSRSSGLNQIVMHLNAILTGQGDDQLGRKSQHTLPLHQQTPQLMHRMVSETLNRKGLRNLSKLGQEQLYKAQRLSKCLTSTMELQTDLTSL
jgi:hypothetical protein